MKESERPEEGSPQDFQCCIEACKTSRKGGVGGWRTGGKVYRKLETKEGTLSMEKRKEVLNLRLGNKCERTTQNYMAGDRASSRQQKGGRPRLRVSDTMCLSLHSEARRRV